MYGTYKKFRFISIQYSYFSTLMIMLIDYLVIPKLNQNSTWNKEILIDIYIVQIS